MSEIGRRYEGLDGGVTRLVDDWEVIASFFILPTGPINGTRCNKRHREGISVGCLRFALKAAFTATMSELIFGNVKKGRRCLNSSRQSFRNASCGE